jgi:predicted nucleic acid-binding protein
MPATLVDSNVLLDIMTEDSQWFSWSISALSKCFVEGRVFVNPLVYAEVSVRFRRIEDLEATFPPERFERLQLPFEAGFLAGKAFLAYRRRGGTRTSVLSDFLIGAHAATSGLRLLTRDARRYRTYFPSLDLIAPGD